MFLLLLISTCVIVVIIILLALLFIEQSANTPEIVSTNTGKQKNPVHLQPGVVVQHKSTNKELKQSGYIDDVIDEEDYGNSSSNDIVYSSPSVQENDELFGAAVAITSSLMAISAPGHQLGDVVNVGCVYIFRRDTRELFRTVFPPVVNDNLKFGTNVQFIDNCLHVTDINNNIYEMKIHRKKYSDKAASIE